MRDAVHHLHCCCCCCVSKKADRPRSTRSLVLCSRCNQAAQAPRSRRADQFYSSVEAHRSKSSAMCSIELLAAGSKKACCEEGERDVKKARRQRPGQTADDTSRYFDRRDPAPAAAVHHSATQTADDASRTPFCAPRWPPLSANSPNSPNAHHLVPLARCFSALLRREISEQFAWTNDRPGKCSNAGVFHRDGPSSVPHPDFRRARARPGSRNSARERGGWVHTSARARTQKTGAK